MSDSTAKRIFALRKRISALPSGKENLCPPLSNGVHALFDTDVAGQILRTDAEIEWPDGMKPIDVRVERGWPTRDGRFVVEWSFGLGNVRRYALWVSQRESLLSPCADADTTDQTDQGDAKHFENSRRLKPAAQVGPYGILGVRVDVPQWGVRIHSPDCDPTMTHLVQCFDEREMAERLAPFWGYGKDHLCRSPGHSDHGRAVECRLLGYRVGRRAAIGYRSPHAQVNVGMPPARQRESLLSPYQRLMGKTYCDGRGEHLLRLHDELDRQLALFSNGRVRVPTPLGYLTDLRMALFAWTDGEKTGDASGSLSDQATLAADVLAALHAQTINGLPNFTVVKECDIIRRWQRALESVDFRLVEATRGLLDTLLHSAESLQSGRQCTLHRDFYEQQFVCGESKDSLCDGRVITLLDLDTLARGDPCVDLGNLLAHMYLSALRAGRSVDEFATVARLVLHRYADQSGWPERRALAFYWASALFRVGAVHALRTTTKVYALSLWQLVDGLLADLVGSSSTGSSGLRGRGVVPDTKWILGVLPS